MRYLKKYNESISNNLVDFIKDVFIPIRDHELTQVWQDQGDILIFYITRMSGSRFGNFFETSLVKDEVEHLISELESGWGYTLQSIRCKKIRNWCIIYDENSERNIYELFDNLILSSHKSINSLEIKFKK